jgi:hypothetical protein
VGPRTGLDDMEKRKFLPSPGLELRPLDSTTLSQSLYRLCYPGFNKSPITYKTSRLAPSSYHVPNTVEFNVGSSRIDHQVSVKEVATLLSTLQSTVGSVHIHRSCNV